MKPYRVLLVLMIFNIVISSCTAPTIGDEFDIMQKTRINIPYNSMSKRICSMFADTITDKSFIIVRYIDENGCTPCEIKKISAWEKINMEKLQNENIGCIYIVKTNYEYVESIYAQFCNARIDGTLYLDTCNVFLQTNLHIPDNPMFHTFVLNKEDSVVLIGDPFLNKKMETLFLNVIKQDK